MTKQLVRHPSRLAALACGALLAIPACAASDSDEAVSTPTETDAGTVDQTVEDSGEETADDGDPASDAAADTDAAEDEEANGDTTDAVADAGCDEVAALFVTRGSANPDLDDPEVSATCDGDDLVVTSNAVPDYTYIETSPGSPRGDESTYTIPASPSIADEVTPIPYIGSAAVTLSGIPIYGPTEGTGGDVDSLPGIVSACGSHNGPTGFHTHKILTSSETDCFFTPEEVAEAPQLVGYAFDGFPIYTGIDQYTSSWELTDETLFASDTWAAHTYVEGSGDLDECNGLTDEDGNYAYYTTEGFPYVLGCFAGVVDLDAAGGGGGGGGGGGAGEDGGDEERPERPENGDEERPERPENGDEERPERPENGDEERPEPIEGEAPADDGAEQP